MFEWVKQLFPPFYIRNRSSSHQIIPLEILKTEKTDPYLFLKRMSQSSSKSVKKNGNPLAGEESPKVTFNPELLSGLGNFVGQDEQKRTGAAPKKEKERDKREFITSSCSNNRCSSSAHRDIQRLQTLLKADDPNLKDIKEIGNWLSIDHGDRKGFLGDNIVNLIQICGGQWGQFKEQLAVATSDGYYAIKGNVKGLNFSYQLATTLHSGNTIEKLAHLMDDAKVQNSNLVAQVESNKIFIENLVHQANTCATSLAQLMERIDAAHLTIAGNMIPSAKATTKAQTPSIQSEAKPDLQITQNIVFTPHTTYTSKHCKVVFSQNIEETKITPLSLVHASLSSLTTIGLKASPLQYLLNRDLDELNHFLATHESFGLKYKEGDSNLRRVLLKQMSGYVAEKNGQWIRSQ